MTNEANNINATKPRRWFRFRLRTLLVMVTLLTVPLGWVEWEKNQRRREKATIAWVEEWGGAVHFRSPLNDETSEISWWAKTKDAWFGERVQYVRFFSATKDIDLSPLAELKNLEQLDLYSTQLTDLSLLAKLKNLDTLRLYHSRVDNLSPLTDLNNLEAIFLYNTLVSEEQLQELRLALPNCEIDFRSR